MKFKDLAYERPDLSALEDKARGLLEGFMAAESFEVQHGFFMDYNKIEKDLRTQAVLSSIRHTVDTLDSFYEGENDFWDESSARLASLGHGFVSAVLASPFLEDYKELYGDHFIESALLEQKVFKEEIMEDLVEESQWASKYQKLMAGIQIQIGRAHV